MRARCVATVGGAIISYGKAIGRRRDFGCERRIVDIFGDAHTDHVDDLAFVAGSRWSRKTRSDPIDVFSRATYLASISSTEIFGASTTTTPPLFLLLSDLPARGLHLGGAEFELRNFAPRIELRIG